MVAKSRPRRRTVFQTNPLLTPDQWPLWVLRFGKGYFPDDKVRQAARMIEFRQWQQDRDAWFADNGLKVDLRVCNEEHRRRAATY